MHFKNSVKSTNLKVLSKAVKGVKSTMSTGKQCHTSTARFTKMRLQHLYCFFVCTVYTYDLWFDLMERVQQRSHDLYSPGGAGGNDSNSLRRQFDCLSKVIKVTATKHQGGICRGGGKLGNSPLTGSDLPSHWFVWKLRGNGKGEGREKGKRWVGENNCLTSHYWLMPQIPPAKHIKGH